MLTINTGHALEAYPGMVSLYLRRQEGAKQFNIGYAMPYKLQTQPHTG